MTEVIKQEEYPTVLKDTYIVNQLLGTYCLNMEPEKEIVKYTALTFVYHKNKVFHIFQIEDITENENTLNKIKDDWNKYNKKLKQECREKNEVLRKKFENNLFIRTRFFI